jgi:hypothetical protein
MLGNLRAWAGALLLAAPLWAVATPVTFTFETTIAASVQGGGSPWPAGFAVGNPLTVSVTFDSGATVNATRNDGNGNPTVYDYDPSSLSFTLTAGAFTETQSFVTFHSGLMRVRDDALDPDGHGDLVDGITFQIVDGDETWTLFLRGPTLDLINGHALPTAQDSRWANQRLAFFQICRFSPTADGCDLGNLDANVIPEPGSLALIATALAGLGVRRRRNRQTV